MSSFVIVKMPHVIKKAPYYIIVTVNDVVSSPQISTIHSRISLYIVQRLVHITLCCSEVLRILVNTFDLFSGFPFKTVNKLAEQSSAVDLAWKSFEGC